jgi:hypothetical protein
MVAVSKNKKEGLQILKSSSLKLLGQLELTLLSPLMTIFQNCVRQPRHPTNMATVAKNRKGG